MDQEARKQIMREKLRKQRDKKYGIPVPTTPEEIKVDAMMKLKNSSLKQVIDMVGYFNGLFERIISTNTNDMVFFKMGEVLENIQEVLNDGSEVLDLSFVAHDLVSLGLAKPEEISATDLVWNRADAAFFLPFVVSFFETEVTTFLNVYHNYY